MRARDTVVNRVNSAPFTSIDVATRTVYFMSDVNEDTAAKFIIGFNALDSTKGPIEVVINSGGGGAVDGYAMFETLRDANNKVITYGIGAVMSAAAVVLQGGSTRILSPFCRFMIHNGSFSIACETDRLPGIMEENKEVDHIYRSILAERSGLSIGVVEKLCKEETYMGAQAAVDWGFADGVSKPRRKYLKK